MTKAEELARLAEGKGPLANTADDEPIFFLVARDRTAAKTVRQWAQNAKDAGCMNAEKIEEAMRLAAAMETWRAAHGHGKIPD